MLTTSAAASPGNGERHVTVTVKNSGPTAAVLVKLTVEDAATGKRILPAYYSDNYISLLPADQRTVTIAFPAGQAQPQIALRAGTWRRKPSPSSKLRRITA